MFLFPPPKKTHGPCGITPAGRSFWVLTWAAVRFDWLGVAGRVVGNSELPSSSASKG